MSENKKDLVLEKEGKVDSTKKVDEKYIKCTELTAEDVKKFPLFEVVIQKIDSMYNGIARSRTSMTLKLHNEFTLVLSGNKFGVNDFYYLANLIFVDKLKKDDGKDTYSSKFPVRFVKGKTTNLNGEEKEYYCCQVLFAKGIAYTLFIRKDDKSYQLFKTLIDVGKIKEPEWVIKDRTASLDDEGNEVYDFE